MRLKSSMDKGGGLMPVEINEGERNLDFPMHIRSNQSLLVDELKSKFNLRL